MSVTQKVPEGPWADAPPIASYVCDQVLAANVAETITAPSDADFVIFSYTATPFYIRVGGAAAVPAADVTDGTGSIVSPTYRRVDRGASISVISPNAGVLSMEWFSR